MSQMRLGDGSTIAVPPKGERRGGGARDLLKRCRGGGGGVIIECLILRGDINSIETDTAGEAKVMLCSVPSADLPGQAKEPPACPVSCGID